MTEKDIEDATRITDRYELVLKQDDFWVAWDSKFGVYQQYEGEFPGLFLIEDHSPSGVLWSTEFERKTGFYDAREAPYLLWKRDSTYQLNGDSEPRQHRWHIIKGGKVICHTDTSNPDPYDDTLTPLDDLSEEARSHSNLCGHCRKEVDTL